jgi:glycosyltransferase involved in cell wall biosynthesis
VRVLIVSYACSPSRGGEASNGWNLAWQLSRFHEVCVLAHPVDRPIVEDFLAKHPNSIVRFHWLAGPRLLWDHQGGNVAVAIHYLQWLTLAYMKAREIHEQTGIDVIHHVSYGTISIPPPFWKLPVPFVWGPVGGGQRVPSAFRRYVCSWSGREILRNIRVALLPFSLSLHRAANASAIVLAANHETYGLLAKAGAFNLRLFLDSGIPSTFVSRPRVPRPRGMPFTLLWVGRMQPRKALPLALEALAQTKDLAAKLLIAGDGKMRREWESYAKHLNLGGRVEFLGQFPWNETSRLYQIADAFLFTSLRDSFGTQVLEAMAHGLPILTLDHQGVGTFLPPETGIRVPVTSPRETVAELARGIRRLASCPEERLKMGEAARAYARTQTWEMRAERISNVYHEVLAGPGCQQAKAVRALEPSCHNQVMEGVSASPR